jgi:hypothetical protein
VLHELSELLPSVITDAMTHGLVRRGWLREEAQRNRRAKRLRLVVDLVDLVLLLEGGPPSAEEIRGAIAATFQTRGTHDIPATLPPPPEFWAADFSSMPAEQNYRQPTTWSHSRSSRGFGVNTDWGPISVLFLDSKISGSPQPKEIGNVRAVKVWAVQKGLGPRKPPQLLLTGRGTDPVDRRLLLLAVSLQ